MWGSCINKSWREAVEKMDSNYFDAFTFIVQQTESQTAMDVGEDIWLILREGTSAGEKFIGEREGKKEEGVHYYIM